MRNKNSSDHPGKVLIGGIELKVCMTKVRNFVEITPNLPFSEFNFYELYRETFEKSELGRMKKLLPLHEMAESLGLVSKSMMPKRGRKSYFTPEGKVALMFLKMKTQMSFPKLMEELNGNIHYQLFCDILIDPTHPLTNYKLLDDIAAELAGSLKIQELQKEHYSLRRVKARKKETEILSIFFGIHTANVVRLAKMLMEQQLAEAA